MELAEQRYQHWCAQKTLDPELRQELAAMQNDADKITDAFYRDLEFGTAGLRGVLGAGYRIFDTRPMYGGKMRCILYRSLKDEKENSDDTGR